MTNSGCLSTDHLSPPAPDPGAAGVRGQPAEGAEHHPPDDRLQLGSGGPREQHVDGRPPVRRARAGGRGDAAGQAAARVLRRTGQGAAQGRRWLLRHQRASREGHGPGQRHHAG
eukprot:scaffold4855_cov261-Pinguiococcus_pyrenoidosus.AAC.1